MKTEEIPVVFPCEKDVLIGIVHLPEKPGERGILAFAAGGPQYRAGVSRQLVHAGRRFSELGTPFMRFDFRGMGDSSGPFMGFRSIGKDLEAAIQIFFKTVPELKDVVLLGGCDAASGIMMHGSRFSQVNGMIIMNPFTVNTDAQKASLRKYYLERLLDKSFWKKVLTGRYNPMKSINSDNNRQKKSKKDHSPIDDSFVGGMMAGMKKFKGNVLLIMNKKNFEARKFDQSIKQNKTWSKVFKRPSIQRVDISSDGQEFAMEESRKMMISIVESWLLKK